MRVSYVIRLKVTPPIISNLVIRHEYNSHPPHVTVSEGAKTFYGNESQSHDAGLKSSADQAVSEAKHSGRLQIVFKELCIATGGDEGPKRIAS